MPPYPDSTSRTLKTISVVIPTLNESGHIAGAIQSLGRQKGLLEIVVVDGGSSDRTIPIAEGLGARVLKGPRGRGLQIHKGVARCRGDVVLILHADCRIRPGMFEKILHRFNRIPCPVGGALGMAYDAHTPGTQLLSWLNNIRARYAGMSFGDQCQFFRRKALDSFGGFPAQMLMEDIELSLRMQAAGPVCFLPRGVVVSWRRWEEKGLIKNFVRVVSLCLGYLVMRRFKGGEAIAADFYTRYYENQ